MKKNKVGIIIQARLSSKRFPNKVLKKIANYTIMEIILKRLERTKLPEKIIFSIPSNKRNKYLYNHLIKIKANVEVGSEDNVLKRFLLTAKKNNLRKTFYFKINVKDENSINESFYKTRSKFDVIIDDSTHDFNDQIKVIKNCYKFLNPGGILIIEDIFKYKKEHAEINYYKNLKNFIKFFTEIFFIDTEHINNFTSNYKCEKILLLIKK